MIHVFTKSEEELKEEQSWYDFGAAVAKGVPFRACPTYVMKTDGTKVDTNALTEEQIVNIIESDLRDWKAPDGSYKADGKSGLDVFDLLEIVRNSWIPSIDALIYIGKMEAIYGHVIRDIIGTIDVRGYWGKATIIAEFQKQSNGDFSPVTTEDIISTLEQMSYNNEMKKKQQQTLHMAK